MKNYTVVIESEGGTEMDLAHFDTVKEARYFCDHYDWMWEDENGFHWEMCIRNNLIK